MNHMYSLTVFEQKYIPFGSVLCGKYYLISGKLYMEMALCSIIFLILLDQNSHSPSNIMQTLLTMEDYAIFQSQRL